MEVISLHTHLMSRLLRCGGVQYLVSSATIHDTDIIVVVAFCDVGQR